MVINMKTEQTIDFVVPWVDGSDPEWQCLKKHYLGSNFQDNKNDQVDVRETRYRDWDNLRYWFRAVETYAPWVNKVHFVTCGQKPEWLNLNAPKLHFVRHEDYIPNEYLPVFSSHPIELHMHRIEGLSERFVYFNDDLFLTAPVKPEDFFVKGLPCDYFEESPLVFNWKTAENGVLVNNMIAVNQHFHRKESLKRLRQKLYVPCDVQGMVKNIILSILNDSYFFGLRAHHLCQAYLKKTLETVWEAEADTLHETSSHKFRDERDVNQYIFKFWQLLQGNFNPYNMRKFGRMLNPSTQLSEICSQIIYRKQKVMCLLDPPEVDFEYAKACINEAFETAFPNKSSFEL